MLKRLWDYLNKPYPYSRVPPMPPSPTKTFDALTGEEQAIVLHLTTSEYVVKAKEIIGDGRSFLGVADLSDVTILRADTPEQYIQAYREVFGRRYYKLLAYRTSDGNWTIHGMG